MGSLDYRSAGVDIDAGEEAVRRIKRHVASTTRPEVIGGIGGFGALFALEAGKYDDPVLVSSTDGVGTKAMIATATGRYDTIGIDLVAMCVDDIVVPRRGATVVPRLHLGRADSTLTRSSSWSRASPTDAGRPAAR